MNGKQAKRLRRAAKGLVVTLTEAGKDIKKDGYSVRKHSNSLSASSTQTDEAVSPSYQLLVRSDSLKGIYKTLKRGS